MLGLNNFWVALGFVLTILSALLCVVYGILKWNEKDPYEEEELKEELQWESKEKEIIEEL